MNSKKEFSPYLEGKRIYLREVRKSDVNQNYYNWMNDPEIIQYLESRFFPNSLDSINEYVAGKAGDRGNVFFAIVLRGCNKHIGNIKLGSINWIHRYGEIGIIVGEKKYWGKGYGTEAISLMIKYAFNVLNLHKVFAGIYSPNKASIRAFENAGFVVEGVKKEQCFFNGVYVDLIFLAIVKGKNKK